jgi:hypothetical protein
MIGLALKLGAAAAGAALVLYGAYVDGQRQKARKQKMTHNHEQGVRADKPLSAFDKPGQTKVPWRSGCPLVGTEER